MVDMIYYSDELMESQRKLLKKCFRNIVLCELSNNYLRHFIDAIVNSSEYRDYLCNERNY